MERTRGVKSKNRVLLRQRLDPAAHEDYASVVRRTFDEASSISYREADESAIQGGGSRLHYCELLGELSASFKRKIDVLDAGCGTGRYFQCLKDVRHLVGIDISPHMIEQARSPAGSVGLDIESIDLRCGDVLSLDLPAGVFDLIYSTGVLGEYSPVNEQLLKTFAGLLKEDGVLFFTAVDASSRVHVKGGRPPSIGRRVVRKLFPFLPALLRIWINRRLSPYFMAHEELEALLSDSAFAEFTITRYEHPWGWRGAHFDCIAFKSAAARTRLGDS
jgi:SAM-dependent methyltransferase